MKQILPLLFFGLVACLSAQTPAVSLVVTSVGSDLSPTIFTAACVDPQHIALSWGIDFGDSSVQQGSGCPPAILSHQYAHAQTYSPLLTVQYAPAITATTTVVILHTAAAHAYFDQWASDPHIVHAYSLRDDVQLDSLAKTKPAAPGWIYDPILDAASGTIYNQNPLDADILPQLWIVDPTDTGTLTFVWDALIPADWVSSAAPFPTKSFQTTKSQGTSLGIFMETRMRSPASGVACVDWRSYGILGPGAFRGSTGPAGCRNSDAVQPRLALFYLQPDIWTRFIEHIELNALVDAGVTYDLWSLWVGDESRDLVQLYDRIPQAHVAGGIKGFVFEYDNSQPLPIGSPPLSVYDRNILMFRNLLDPAPLLVKPLH